MALSRVKTWSVGEVLTSSDLNAEFNNILNNALSLISPLTGDLAYGGNRATGLSAGSVSSPSLQPTGDTNTGVYFSAADTVDIACGGVRAAQFTYVASGVNYLVLTPAAAGSGVELNAAGSDTDISMTIDAKGAGSLILRTAGGSTEMGRMTSASGFLWGTTQTTDSTGPDIVIANLGYLKGVNAAGNSNRALIGLNASNHVVIAGNGDDIKWGRALVAMGGGSAPTLGTIGGSGPATATQNAWMRVVDSGGTAFYVPTWV